MRLTLAAVILVCVFDTGFKPGRGLEFGMEVHAAPVAALDLICQPLEIGDNVIIAVWAYGADPAMEMLAFGFNVSFDSGGVLDYTGYAMGPGFDDESFDQGVVAGSAFPGITKDAVLLAALFFKTMDYGVDTVNVEGLYDGSFLGLYYALEDQTPVGYDIDASLDVTVTAEPAPLPASFVLLGSGFAGVFIVRRKFTK